MTVTRRLFLSGSLALLFGSRSSRAAPHSPDAIAARLRTLEIESGGRLGVQILDTGSGGEYGHRADERFMMLSTFKLLASAFVLHRVDLGEEALDRRIQVRKEDLVDWSPVTEHHLGGAGMSLAALCEAAMTISDNTAANLILASFGGPASLTGFLRSLGDHVTRLDRIEPALNSPHSTDPMDTTTPRAMAGTLRKLLLEDVLTPGSRNLLLGWLADNKTGAKRLRAGLPPDWWAGEKTGTFRTNANDVGMFRPMGWPPLLVAAFLADGAGDAAARDSILAKVGHLVADITV